MVYNRFPIRWQRLIVSDAINNIVIYYDYFLPLLLAVSPNPPARQRRRRRRGRRDHENQLRCQSDNLLGPRRRTIQSNARENGFVVDKPRDL